MRPQISPGSRQQVIVDLMMAAWGSSHMTVGMQLYDVAQIDAHGLYSAEGHLLAFTSWTERGSTIILCATHALVPGRSYARHLLDGLVPLFREKGATRMRAVTTNDNMSALIFYQRYGFRLSTCMSARSTPIAPRCRAHAKWASMAFRFMTPSNWKWPCEHARPG